MYFWCGFEFVIFLKAFRGFSPRPQRVFMFNLQKLAQHGFYHVYIVANSTCFWIKPFIHKYITGTYYIFDMIMLLL